MFIADRHSWSGAICEIVRGGLEGGAVLSVIDIQLLKNMPKLI
jgi:hypothetical protein